MKFKEITIEVFEPDFKNDRVLYSDVLIYLIKTVSQLDPKYEYLVGLTHYSLTTGLTDKQKKLANDLIYYFLNKKPKDPIND